MQNYLDFIHHLQHKLKKHKMSHWYSCTFGLSLASNVICHCKGSEVSRLLGSLLTACGGSQHGCLLELSILSL